MYTRTRHSLIAAIVGVSFCCVGVAAELKLPAVISDNMMLQCDQPLPIWGWAAAGEKVTVEIAGKSAEALADTRGRWQVRLPALAAGQRPLEMAVRSASGGACRVKNILVGEVWLCCGPSNIFWPVKRCDNAAKEMAAADDPQVRFFTVARKMAEQPQDDCEGHWVECTPESVADVSGVGYFFVRQLHRELKTPVALLQSFWGGSRIEAWTSLEALKQHAEFAPIFDYHREHPGTSAHRPAVLYNGMIAPLIPFGIRGAINYQGLGNLVWPEQSRPLLEAMIADWRKRWGQGDFPIGMVQPSPYTCKGWASSGPDAYSIQRAAQLEVMQRVPKIGLALTMDIDAVDTLHPPHKQPVAARMAAWALATVYGRPAQWQGPIYESLAIEGEKIRVRFAHAEGLRTSDGKPPTCFTIAGADKQFHPATATIEGSTVVVQSPDVPQPVAVRFAWQNTDVPNLVNAAGLPASLMRSDAW